MPTHTKTYDRFLLDGTVPTSLSVSAIISEGQATQKFAVVADYGWAEKILCGDCYEQDANDIARTIAEFFDIPYKMSN